jgi:hypothetical protein
MYFKSISQKLLTGLLAISFLVLPFACEDEEPAQPQPAITSLNITEGEVGTDVTITGTNFGAVVAEVSVTFNGTPATVKSVTNTQVVAPVPAGASSGAIKVKVKTLEVTGPNFTVLAPITVSVQPFTTSLNENPSAGAVIGTMTAATNRGSMTYAFTSQSVANAMAINTSTGQFTVATPAAFDHEVNASITAVVTVSNGAERATANVTVTIANVAEVNISNFTGSIAENPAANAVIGSVTSESSGGTSAFAITTQSISGAIAINSTNGQLTVGSAAAFDFEVNPSLTATVTVTNRSEVKTATVTVNVTNALEVSISNFTGSIAENMAAGIVIGNMVVEASGGTSVFSITSQSVANAISINSATGQLTVGNASAFNFEVNPTLTATASVTNRSEVKTATVTITVTDVDETVNVSLIAGSATQTGCAAGSGSAIRFTSPFFGSGIAADDGFFNVFLADLSCGVANVFVPASAGAIALGTASSTNLHSFGAGTYALDVIRFGSNYLATYYSPSTGRGQILKIPTDGSPVSTWASEELFMPTGIHAGSDGLVYVAETDGRKIKGFNSNGVLTKTIGTGAIGTADGAIGQATFRRTRDVIGDASGNLFIADQFSVRKVNAAGQVSTLASGFNETHGLALLPGGSILVADHLNGQIKKIDPNGNVTTVLQNLSAPRGIIVQDARTFFFTQQGLPGLYKATSAIDL